MAINVTGPCDDQAVLHHEMGLTLKHWWEGDADERYWVEIRWVDGIGTELRCPQFDGDGRRNGWYDLVTQVQPGEIVYHWNAREHRFVGRSSVAARCVVDDHGDRVVALNDFAPIQIPVGLDDLRRIERDVLSLRTEVRQVQPSGPLYLPFQFRRDGLRMISNYFAKWPSKLVTQLFGSDGLAGMQGSVPEPQDGPDSAPSMPFTGGYLRPFKPRADTDYTVKVQQDVRLHHRHHETLVREFASWLKREGFAPGCNAAIDLGLIEPPVVIEAKIVGKSWAVAIRAAVGQLYEYRYFQVVSPDSKLLFLADRPVPDPWLAYLEIDRGIGAVSPDRHGWRLSRLARQALGV